AGWWCARRPRWWAGLGEYGRSGAGVAAAAGPSHGTKRGGVEPSRSGMSELLEEGWRVAILGRREHPPQQESHDEPGDGHRHRDPQERHHDENGAHGAEG